MTTMTMAPRATADAPLRVKANPASKVKATAQPVKKSLRRNTLMRAAPWTVALGMFASLQVGTAGPAAVATLPSDLALAHGLSVIEKAPTLGRAQVPQPNGELFASILNEAFPTKTVDPETTGSVEPKDPNELMEFGSRRAPRWLVETIQKAARVTGVDPVYMVTLADVESSLSPVAKAPTSSAAGLYQFIDRTWLEVLHMHAAKHGFGAVAESIKIVDEDPVVTDESKRAWILGLKRDPYFSALMAAELIKDVQNELRLVGERELAEAELYLAHFFGAGSAVRFLQALDENPDAVAARLFPKAAKANRGLFSARKGKRSRNITVAELYDRIDDKIVRRMDRFGTVAQPAAPTQRTPTLEATAQPAD